MEMSSTVQRPSAAHLRTASNVESRLAAISRNTSKNATYWTFIRRTVTSVWPVVPTSWSEHLNISMNNFFLWSLCIALLAISCILEQNPSLVWLRLALCLACFWLVPISIHIRTLMRQFRDCGRDDSFIVATSMLSFAFIKAFALLDGYNMIAFIRVPPCLTFAAWIASHWCNSDVPAQIQFGV